MRALLIVAVGTLTLACIAGIVGFTGYALWLATMKRETVMSPAEQQRAAKILALSIAFSVLMIACAGVLAGTVIVKHIPDRGLAAIRSAVLPLWAATAATATMLLQHRELRRRAPNRSA